jgi:chaperone required for assembly of F1-ATPase
MTTIRRFYQKATVEATDGPFRILLDGKPVHTPAKVPLVLPNRKAAEAVAAEWQAQGEKVNPAVMPFTRLANTAIDRVAPNRAATIDEITRYGASDLICYRTDNPEELAERQAVAWNPLLEWLAAAHDVHLQTTTGIVFLHQRADDLARLHGIVAAFDEFSLVGLHNITSVAGSLVIGLGVAAGQISAPEAAALSTIDETYQSERWGEDEEALKRLQGRARELAEAAAFLSFFRGL